VILGVRDRHMVVPKHEKIVPFPMKSPFYSTGVYCIPVHTGMYNIHKNISEDTVLWIRHCVCDMYAMVLQH
jgi:hypothetical protein